ncbi:hypothetical protein [Liquorilactobacillus mali]|uniref:hypothetical protein n=1 Tax=Liquorilactobacillus mali TaxID=1618 RepID=UPI0002493501|nr:hypothetical protein [Liquorilactobacillus mali]
MINFYKNIWFYVGLSLIGLLLLVIFNAPASWYYYDILICAIPGLIKGDDSLKKSIIITKNAKAQTNVWEFMRSTGWMMVIAIIYLVTKMIIAIFS